MAKIPAPSLNDLSARERQIAQRYAGGETYKAIALALYLSPATIRTHLNRIYQKLAIRSKAELTQLIYQQAYPDLAYTTLASQDANADISAENGSSLPETASPSTTADSATAPSTLLAERRKLTLLMAQLDTASLPTDDLERLHPIIKRYHQAVTDAVQPFAGYLVGDSRLTEADEMGTHRQLSASLDVIADRIRNAGGEVVNYAEDAVLACFESTVAATHCAIGIQNTLRTLCTDLADAKRLLFRIGINVGEVTVDRKDIIYGNDVNVAARLGALAEPGGICISASVYQQVQDTIKVQFHDSGEQTLKNIEHPVHVYRIVSESIASNGRDESTANLLRISRCSHIVGPQTPQELADVFVRAEPPSIMILPFRNVSGHSDEDALVDGLRLSIQSSLVKLSGLFLINAPVSEPYRHNHTSAIQAGNEVGVRYVIDGAVQTAGDQLRVTVQLIDAPKAQIVWAEHYDGGVDDVFNIQDDITTAVAVALNVKLLTGDDSLIWWDNLPDRTARELVLRGISHLYKGSESGNAIARRIFAELNQLYPESTQALALVAYTYWLDIMRGWSKDPAQSTHHALTRAEKAIDLGDPDGFAHVIVGSVRLFQRRHDEALALAEKAVTSRINCPMARAVYANVLHFSGQHDRAIKHVKTAIKHARIYPPWTANVLSASYRESGQIAASISVAHECLRIDPENLDGHVLLCIDYGMSKSVDNVRKEKEHILRINPAFSIAAYCETQPYQDCKSLEDIAGTLSDAGLPE